MMIPCRALPFATLFLGTMAFSYATIRAEDLATPKPARKIVKLPGATIDLEQGHVDLEATIRVNDGLLELVACTRDTKEHESIVAVVARPMHIHTALLLLGANNGHPAMRKAADAEMTRWVDLPPRGDLVDVMLVVTNKEGKKIERPISDFVLYSKQRIDEGDDKARGTPDDDGEPSTDKAMRFPHTFVFTGSHVVDNGDRPRRYLADESGDVISIATFGDEVLSLPHRETHTNDALLWRANPKTLPEAGTKVTLRLRPKPTAKQPVDDESSVTDQINKE